MKYLSSKELSFIAVMSALGNILSFLSIRLVPFLPNINLGSVNVSLALDLSHLTTFISALYGGPVLGGLTGMMGGLVGSYEFGFSQGNYITGFLLPVGKGLTGLTAGLLLRKMKPEISRLMFVIATIISHIPETFIVYIIFVVLMPVYFGLPSQIAWLLTIQITLKANLEMIIMGVLLSLMTKNQGFTQYISKMYMKQ